jgi:glycosyltransferase involved in cell wall biosynthesis
LVPGEPRQTKGFDVLVDALEHLTGPLQQGQLRLTVQSLPIDRVEPSLRRCVARLSVLTKDSPNIEVVARALSREEYDDVLSRCDFVILPYRRASYSQQSSGIAFEALAYGKPFVLTEGLSFASVAVAHNAVVEVPDGNPVALAQGIKKMMAELPMYRARAEMAAAEVEKQHSIKYLFGCLISLFSLEYCCGTSKCARDESLALERAGMACTRFRRHRV